MPCHYPVRAVRIGDSRGRSVGVVFTATKGMNVIREFHVPCGKCTGCQLERARQWAVRCMHEAQMHPINCFITLTYNDEHLPDLHSLNYRDVQLFLKRLRSWTTVYDYRTKKALPGSKIRYFLCGEYGEQGTRRPHYHVILFNWDFADKVEHAKSKSGNAQYTSEHLDSLWGKGHATITECNYASAQYVAQYCTKKLSGDKGIWDYQVLDPETGEIHQREKEFVRMSLKPGIGMEWYKKFQDEVWSHDRVIVKGLEVKPPAYYSRILKKEDPEAYEEIQARRELKARKKLADNTEERLLVKEKVAKAKLEFYSGKRSL